MVIVLMFFIGIVVRLCVIGSIGLVVVLCLFVWLVCR